MGNVFRKLTNKKYETVKENRYDLFYDNIHEELEETKEQIEIYPVQLMFWKKF